MVVHTQPYGDPKITHATGRRDEGEQAMRYVALIGRGPRWIADKPVWEQGRPIQEHLAAMRDRYDEGRLLLGGPFTDPSGGIAVLDVEDEAAAVALMEADPGVRAGVLVYTLHAMRAYFDAFTGLRTEQSATEPQADALGSTGRR
jgi:uncharacterized protein YciI